MSATTSAAGSTPPANDGWAILAAPPGHRDLAVARYWDDSRARSRRRRAARRRPALLARGGARLSVALAAVALGGPAAGTAVAATDAAAQSPAHGPVARRQRPAVRALQRALHITADGAFGPGTQRAVRAFQRAHDLRSPAAPTRPRRRPSASATARPRRAATRPAPAASRSRSRAARSSACSEGSTSAPTARSARARAPRCAATSAPTACPPTGAPTRRCSTTWASTPGPGTEQPASAPAPAAGVRAAVDAARVEGRLALQLGRDRARRVRLLGPGDVGDAQGRHQRAAHELRPVRDRQRRVARQDPGGDLVFFDTNGAGASDVGMATGAKTAVSATTHGVMTHAILSGYGARLRGRAPRRRLMLTAARRAGACRGRPTCPPGRRRQRVGGHDVLGQLVGARLVEVDLARRTPPCRCATVARAASRRARRASSTAASSSSAARPG